MANRLRRGLSTKQRSRIFQRDGYQCMFRYVEGRRCSVKGTPFDYTGLTIEHIVPLSYGGTNDPSNLETLCEIHNRQRDKEWRALHGNRHRPREPVTFMDLVRGGRFIEELFQHRRQ